MRVSLELKTDGTGPLYPVYFRISDGQKRSYKQTGYKVKMDQWDKSGQVIINHTKASNWNKSLMLKLQELTDNVTLTKETTFKTEKRTTFQDIVKQFLAFKGYEAPQTLERLESLIKHLNEFRQVKYIQDINYDYLKAFYGYLKDGKKLMPRSIVSYMDFLKALFKFAIDRLQMIQYTDNPFLLFKLPKLQKHLPEYLTGEEVRKLQDAVDRKLMINKDHSPLHSCAIWFLFSCYTGLRLSDLEQFNRNMIVDNRIVLRMVKTKELVSIPITPEARKIINLIDKCQPITRAWQQKMIINVGKFIGLNKKLHFHMGRHTFATLCANNKISIEVTSKLLGHTDIKTTQIYYHLANTTIENELLSKFKF